MEDKVGENGSIRNETALFMKVIPKFYEKKDKANQQARSIFLEKLSKESIENDELQQLWALLEKSASQPLDIYREQKINYLEFKEIAQSFNSSSKIRSFFTPTVFARLSQGNSDGVAILTFFNYVLRKIWMQQARAALSLWDSSGNGTLYEYELENYIKELIPTLSKLKQLDTSYYQFYTCIAVRKFFFFLDPLKYNKVKITDILCSGFLDELLELRNEQTTRTREEYNWFSVANTIRLYNIYLNLDLDHNGMLSKSEFLKYGNFTEAFVDRLFEVCMTYNREIVSHVLDFKTFIDIILALENRKELQSIYFFFHILDINSTKYIDDFVLRYFFKPIQNQMKLQGQEPIDFADFCNEIFDMVRPATSKQIYIEDLLSSGFADTLVSILIDFNGFYAYENRESNIHVKGVSNNSTEN
ncbi:Serine/threonine-protein phosphatase 2A regulatory subunit B'' subunit gamma [Tyrophagus putrescentiae]|nr:Serine/threonine-protein phosphatase 2A regulatory subunit B'' subunit gamma [Tyrophagus putrescentiae]